VRWPWRRGPQALREAALRTAAPGPLRDYLSVPFPDDALPLAEVPLLALDLETTGLDLRRDRVLSAGFVPVDGLRIELGGARHLVVRDGGGVGQSATVHGLTDDVVAAGEPLEDVVAAVLEALRGRALLAHFARIEVGFLDAVCRRAWGAGFPCVVVDTLELERRAHANPWAPPAEVVGGLRLFGARERRGLPPYPAHHALLDALACGELYLAQAADLVAASPRTSPTLRHVVA
jgi:DNA polymerase-3 subunit epsilon